MASLRFSLPSRRLMKGFIRQSHPERSPIECRRFLYANNSFLKVSEEVQDALQSGRPVVALETTIYTHGMSFEQLLLDVTHSSIRVSVSRECRIGIPS